MTVYWICTDFIKETILVFGTEILIKLRHHDTEEKQNLETDMGWKIYPQECLSIHL